jgi:small conductance mechanosensitive channel
METKVNFALEWLKKNAVPMGGRLLAALAILIIGYMIAQITVKIVRGALKRSRVRDNVLLIRFTLGAIKWTIMIFVLITALAQLKINVGALVAGVGVAGFVIGFALKDVLANFASGVLLIVRQPFKEGNFVQVGGEKGIIEELNVFSTVLRTPDNKVVVLPNSKVWGDTIINYAGYETRRMELKVGISYSSDMDKAISVVKKIMEKDKRILREPEPFAGVTELGDSSVNLIIRPWVKLADYWPLYFDLTKKVKEEFDKAGIKIPFPQRVIHMRKE